MQTKITTHVILSLVPDLTFKLNYNLKLKNKSLGDGAEGSIGVFCKVFFLHYFNLVQ